MVTNDIPAILARIEGTKLDASRSIERVGTLGTLLRTDVPNMAAEILSLRKEKARLDWLLGWLPFSVSIRLGGDKREMLEGIDAGIEKSELSRREKENAG